MCNPGILIAAQTALKVGGQVVDYVGQKKAYDNNVTASNLGYAQNMNVLEDKRVQIDQARSENAMDTAITGAANEGRIAASATDSGLAGTSILRAINTSMFGLGRNAESENLNDRNSREQLASDRIGADMQRQRQIASRAKPSSLALAIGVGSSLVGGVSDYKNATKGS